MNDRLSTGKDVSIHAPGWARLTVPSSNKRATTCFNSRARVGATRTPLIRSAISLVFQFTRPGGRDRRHPIHLPHPTCFNSRARVGATRVSSFRVPLLLFQFTRPGGRDLATASAPTSVKRFQFTRPGGRDRTAPTNLRSSGSFNSRARVGATRPPAASSGG